MKDMKVSRMNKIDELERIIVELEEWNTNKRLSEDVEYIIGEVKDVKQRDQKVEFYKESILAIQDNFESDGKLYLSEIIEKENVNFSSNNLILSPVGSGKTSFIYDIMNKCGEKALMLVSNTALKNSIAPNDDEVKRLRADRTYTTQNKKAYGDGCYEIHVMSYAEFGGRVRVNDDFLDGFKFIFCDEIHSLPNYQGFGNSADLALAIKSLFARYEGKCIYYFTATDEYLIDMEKKNPGVLRNVKTFDFRNHSNIKRYTPLSEYKFNHIEQIRPHLRARHRTFKYFGYKGLAFSRTIEGQKRIAKIAEEEGFTPLILWSINNSDENLKMSDVQLYSRDKLLREGLIPEPYNFLIINSAMQEGWNLYDDKVKLAVMNTTSETEKIQALGRLRNDIDILAYKVKRGELPTVTLIIPDEFINKPLDSVDKSILCEKLNVINRDGVVSKWTTIKSLLNDDNKYSVRDHTRAINGRRVRVSTITLKEEL